MSHKDDFGIYVGPSTLLENASGIGMMKILILIGSSQKSSPILLVRKCVAAQARKTCHQGLGFRVGFRMFSALAVPQANLSQQLHPEAILTGCW